MRKTLIAVAAAMAVLVAVIAMAVHRSGPVHVKADLAGQATPAPPPKLALLCPDNSAVVLCGAYAKCDLNPTMACSTEGPAELDLLLKRIQASDGLHDGQQLQRIYARLLGTQYQQLAAQLHHSRLGHLTPDGKMWVNGTVVASGVFFADRQTQKYSRPISGLGLSLHPAFEMPPPYNTMLAYVVMGSQGFRYAILAENGDPVIQNGKG